MASIQDYILKCPFREGQIFKNLKVTKLLHQIQKFVDRAIALTMDNWI